MINNSGANPFYSALKKEIGDASNAILLTTIFNVDKSMRA